MTAWRWWLGGAGVVLLGALLLRADDGSPLGTLGTSTLIDKVETWGSVAVGQLPASYKGILAPRDVAGVDTVTIHQTGVAGGYGVTKGQAKAAGGDVRQARLTRYQTAPYHGLYSPAERASIVQWPAWAHTYHGHRVNGRSVGWAYDGLLPGDTLDVERGRASLRHLIESARAQGAAIRFVTSHAAHSADRGGDPGAEIWTQIVLPMLEPLGLEVSTDTTGTGTLPVWMKHGEA